MCVGAYFAMFSMKVILASMLANSQVKIAPSVPYKQFFHCGVAEPKNIMGKFVSQKTAAAPNAGVPAQAES